MLIVEMDLLFDIIKTFVVMTGDTANETKLWLNFLLLPSGLNFSLVFALNTCLLCSFMSFYSVMYRQSG